MNVADFIAKVRNDTHTSEYQLTDNQILDFINEVRNDVANDIITRINEDFFRDVLTIQWSTQIDVNEYSLKKCEYNVAWVKKVNSVEIKRHEDTPFQLLDHRKNTSTNLTMDELNALPESAGFFDIKDNSVFIYPAPKESVASGIRMQAVVSLLDLTLAWTEADFFPWHSELREYLNVLVYWVDARVFRAKRYQQEAQEAEVQYNNKRREMLIELSDRYNEPLQTSLPAMRESFMY